LQGLRYTFIRINCTSDYKILNWDVLLLMRIRFYSFWLSVGAVLLSLVSCNDKICPSYSSYFILDNSNADRINMTYVSSAFPDPSYYLYSNPLRDRYFSYLNEDSIPRENIVTVLKDQFGIVEKQGYRKKERSLQSIPMEVVIPEPDDSLKFAGDQELLAELDIVDSAAIDSAVTKGKIYKYNNDQKYYLWYFRNKLVWKDELAKEDEELPEEGEEAGEESGGEEVKEGFFKRIFGNLGSLFKKKEPEPDPAVDEPPAEDQQEEENGF